MLTPRKVFGELGFKKENDLLSRVHVFSGQNNIHIGLMWRSGIIISNIILNFKLGHGKSHSMMLDIND